MEGAAREPVTVSIFAATVVTLIFVAKIMAVLWVLRLAQSMMIGRYRSPGQLLVVLVAVGLLTVVVMNRFADGVFVIAREIRT
jgi:hypothetical protein